MKVTAIGKKVTVQKDTDIAGMMTTARLEFNSAVKRCFVLDSHGVSSLDDGRIDCLAMTTDMWGGVWIGDASVCVGTEAHPASLSYGGTGEIEFEDPPDE